MLTQAINLDALRKTPVIEEPFPHLIVPGFILPEAADSIDADYPKIKVPGSLPLKTLKYGSYFKRFMDEIHGPDMTKILGEKFGMDLTKSPTMITVRGQCRASDGQIHTDSETKLVTVLIYMNGKWEEPGGQLRLLRSATNLDDVFTEIPPTQGTLLAFKNQPNAWHGHVSFEGPRRVIQLNWMRDSGVVWREQIRHRISAFFKKRRKGY